MNNNYLTDEQLQALDEVETMLATDEDKRQGEIELQALQSFNY